MSTKLGTIINRMDRIQTISTIDAVYKVQDIDEAIRTARRRIKFPWALTPKDLRIFAGVELYNPESDFDGLAFLDDSTKNKTNKPDFNYTSIKQFYEDPNNRNLIAEIWNNTERKLGVKYKNSGLTETLLDDCSDLTKYTNSGDFTSLEQEEVNVVIGNYSVKAVCVKNTNIASVVCDMNNILDADYKKKYFFAYIYFADVPTSVDLKISKDGFNYLSKNILVQFDGGLFKAGEWNLLAFDLNNCVVEGNTAGEFNSYQITLNGAESGNYYIGETFLREWKALNYQYYSKYLIRTSTGDLKEQFIDANDNSYDLTDELIGEDIFSDIMLYEAECSAINEKENQTIYAKADANRQDAWLTLFETYPDLCPDITTNYYNFIENGDFGQDNSDDND